MKKSILIAAVIVAASFTSCKKDHTCTCDYTTETTVVTSIPGQPTKTEVSTSTATNVKTYTKSKKRAAKYSCLSYKTTDESATTYQTRKDAQTVTCKIK